MDTPTLTPSASRDRAHRSRRWPSTGKRLGGRRPVRAPRTRGPRTNGWDRILAAAAAFECRDPGGWPPDANPAVTAETGASLATLAGPA
jgi:hypothetical protein